MSLPKKYRQSKSPPKAGGTCPSDIVDDEEFEDITGLASPPPGECPSDIIDVDDDSGWGNGGF